MNETELKFLVDPEHAAAIDAALRRGPSTRVSIESRYFDTGDRRLAEAGLSLRLRKTGRHWEQTLKGPGGSAVERLEETVARPGSWGPDGPPIAPALHDGTPAGALLQSVLAQRGAEPPVLAPVYTSTFVRRAVEVDTGQGRVEVALDRGELRAGTASAPICEVELELKEGDARALVDLARAGIAAHGLALSTVSKAARGDRLARSEPPTLGAKARSPRLDRSWSGPVILGAMLKACIEQVIENAGEVAAGQRDAEAIHQLRVGLRRMRTAAGELGALAPAFDRGWEPAATAAFRALGAYRDRDTVAQSLRLAAAGSPQPSLAPPRADPPDPVAVVRQADFQHALLDVLRFTLAPSDAQAAQVRSADGKGADDDDGNAASRASGSAAGTAPGDALRQIDSRLSRLQRRLERNAKDFARLDDSAQHQARKRLKRLRYLAELAGPLYAAPKVERYLVRLRPAQDALGMHIDLLVGIEMAKAAAADGDAKAWFNVGWLKAQQPASAKRCAKALQRASKARRFW